MIKAIISIKSRNQIFTINSTTEPFITIIIILENFYMINGSTSSNSTKSESVNFITFTNVCTSVTDRYITHYAGIVIVVISAVLSFRINRKSFNISNSCSGIYFCFTKKDYSSPKISCRKRQIIRVCYIV